MFALHLRNSSSSLKYSLKHFRYTTFYMWKRKREEKKLVHYRNVKAFHCNQLVLKNIKLSDKKMKLCKTAMLKNYDNILTRSYNLDR